MALQDPVRFTDHVLRYTDLAATIEMADQAGSELHVYTAWVKYAG